MKRSAGVLMNISSLPGPYGIGTFGKSARLFCDFLAAGGFSVWQVLPLGTLDQGFSPYASDGAFAGNPLYIDPELLYQEGLITRKELDNAIYEGSAYTVDYVWLTENRNALLKNAYHHASSAFKEKVREYAKNSGWIEDYALFRACKDAHNGKVIPYEEAIAHRDDYAKAASVYAFTQYLFETQWTALKAYANTLGIQILGDIPVYLAAGSFEVWAHPEEFLLDERHNPTKVAGVPPDYFSEDGQLWGNPIYNWEAMKENGFKFWIQRIRHALSLYDMVRIDHFRGLASYWAIPAEAKSAKEGKFEKGPGMDLFSALFAQCPSPNIIAEDLGVFGEDVVALLQNTGFPGMRVVQFGFLGGESSHLPHNYPENAVAYTGTHDNNTLLGWLWELTPEERQFLFDYMGYNQTDFAEGGYQAPCVRAVIEMVWRTHAYLAILPFQDMCGFGKDTRMNIPGVPEANWRYRATQEVIDGVDIDYFRKINHLFGRA